LTIVLYKGPLTRAEIDYIRGVNSSFILRHLSIRGLVERIPNPKDARSFLYRPTFDLFQHLGLSKIEELPEYGELISQLENLDVKSEEHFVGH
ncbi:MAG: SMC-Scp complex subunit ScpB, partial [Candidatus Vogelbacteria bacterium]|nr:SMC-Scp complex subunit ScpB [Candidatus Vogelbacteria bacterium]